MNLLQEFIISNVKDQEFDREFSEMRFKLSMQQKLVLTWLRNDKVLGIEK